MTETQRRIRAYKRALPELRERVVAVALLLAMSASMLASASFAWVTLSTSPEVTGMATTVAANGNLEIALASGSSTGSAEEPAESGTRDSSATQGIVSSNTTWGNLINLSDPSYGISNIALRPALLNQTQLNKYPLYGAKYGEDGRVIGTTDRYEFASWQDIGNGVMAFGAGDKAEYGVRAITSVKKDTAVGTSKMDTMLMNVTNAHNDVAAKYKQLVDRNNTDLTSGRSCISALEGLVGVFAQDKVNFMGDGAMAPDDLKNKNVSCSDYLYDFYEMLYRVKEVLELEGDMLVQMANLQAFSANGGENETTFADRDALVAAYKDGTAKTLGVDLDTLPKFIANYNKVCNCITNLEKEAKKFDAELGIERFNKSKYALATMPEVYYSNVSYIVNELANVGTTTINGLALNDFNGSNITAIASIVTSKDNTVIIHDGVLRELDQRVFDEADRLNASMTVKIRIKMGLEMNPEAGGVVTTAEPKANETFFTYGSDLNKLGNLSYTGSGDAVAKDTYGMAIDLWVRTNYSGAVLTLEGSPIYEGVQETITVAEEENGTTTNKIYGLYTVTVDEMPHDVYKKNDSDGKWYDATSHEEFDVQGQTPEEKMRQYVIGYEGENRVWSESALEEMGKGTWLVDDATTQGGGSCFVFYADAEKQEKMKEMLESFNIAFLDENGTKLATAKLNTNLAYESAGKVTVPLEVTYQGVSYEEDGISKKGITTLTQNEATRITAIVYLDGTDLKNENVLDAGELTGQLNIQFGTNSVLLAPADEELMQEHRTITASAVGDGGKTWSNGSAIEYPAGEYMPAGHKITVTLNVDGVAPDTISGFFVRKISETQGTRQDSVTFTKVDGKDGLEWTADFTLTDPGTYVLSDLVVNGLQYTLDADNQPEVKIGGLEIGTVTTLPAAGTYMTANSSYNVTVTVPVHDSTGTPSRVTAYFYEQGNKSNQISAILTRGNDNNWTGTATFNKSGTYVLDFINVDGNALTVDTHPTFIFQLGLKCIVYSGVENGATDFVSTEQSLQVPMLAKITDDSGSELTNLNGVTLAYSVNGSATLNTTCQMSWNGSYYQGELNLTKNDSYYDFKSLSIGNYGTITSAEAAPRLTWSSNEPLKLENNGNGKNAWAEPYQYALSGATGFEQAVFHVNLNSATAVVEATVENENGSTKTITAGAYSESSYPFYLNEGGTWTLKSIRAKRSNDTEWTELNGFDAVKFYVVSGLTVTGNIDGTALDVTKALSGTFLQAHTVNLNLTVQDQSGNELPDALKSALKSVVWNGTYQTNTAQNYGSYTVSGSAPWDDSEVAFTDAAATVQRTVTYAGEYTTTITLNLEVNGKAFQYTNTPSPKLTVSSTKPEVKVTGVDTIGNSAKRIYFEDGEITSTNNLIAGDFAGMTDYSAVAYVYFDEVSGLDNDELVTPKYPKVTLSLLDPPAGISGATMSFKGIGETNQDSYLFQFDSAGQATQSIGKGEKGEFSEFAVWVTIEQYPKIYPAGKMVQDQIVVTHNNATVTAKLANAITINNPLYPSYVDFNSTSADGVTLNTTPARIYATVNDNGDMQVTLPNLSDWTTAGELVQNGDFVVQSTNSRKVYRQWWKGFSSKYESYTETTTVSVASSSKTTWTNHYSLSKWKIGQSSLTPGQVVTLSGANTATAELQHWKSNEATVATRTTRTEIKYTDASGTLDSKPSGATKIDTGNSAPTDSTTDVTETVG